MEHYSAMNRNILSSHERLWRKYKCILLSEKKLIWKGYILCYLIYMTFWKNKHMHGWLLLIYPTPLCQADSEESSAALHLTVGGSNKISEPFHRLGHSLLITSSHGGRALGLRRSNHRGRTHLTRKKRGTFNLKAEI